ncbi:hypothetical protein D3C72_2600630 [compost metagenome]
MTIRPNAAYGLVMSFRACMIGNTHRVARPPKNSIEVRRPMRSDKAPNTGCRIM